MMRDIQEWLEREEAGLAGRASVRELSRAAAYFRHRARMAETPQERDFYADRAYQFALRAAAR